MLSRFGPTATTSISLWPISTRSSNALRQAGGLSTAIGDGNLPMGKIARRPWGEVSFYLHDPSGNPLCFVDEQSVYRGPKGS